MDAANRSDGSSIGFCQVARPSAKPPPPSWSAPLKTIGPDPSMSGVSTRGSEDGSAVSPPPAWNVHIGLPLLPSKACRVSWRPVTYTNGPTAFGSQPPVGSLRAGFAAAQSRLPSAGPNAVRPRSVDT